MRTRRDAGLLGALALSGGLLAVSLDAYGQGKSSDSSWLRSLDTGWMSPLGAPGTGIPGSPGSGMQPGTGSPGTKGQGGTGMGGSGIPADSSRRKPAAPSQDSIGSSEWLERG